MRTTGRSILVVNVGSSTLKFGLYPLASGDEPVLHGVLEYSSGSGARLRVNDSGGKEGSSEPVDASRDSAAAALLEYLRGHSLLDQVQVVGHRLVHGGPDMRQPVRIDHEVRAKLELVVPLAPDHLPIELRAIDEVARLAPNLAQIACFDTAFHSEMPAVARMFGLPRSFFVTGVMRYGFHGLSYQYVVSALRHRHELPARTIIAHLGSGASVAAVLNGVSVDTSMGLTPSGGLPMSTRSGDLDPGVILYLLRSAGLSVTDVDDAINRRGGLLGVSESSSDVRDLLAARGTDSRANDAIDLFCYQTTKFIGAYAAALGGIDALVFTGGIGTHSPEVRAQVCEPLGFLGIELDPALNRGSASIVSAVRSRAKVYALDTNEEAMIARHVRAVSARYAIPD